MILVWHNWSNVVHIKDSDHSTERRIVTYCNRTYSETMSKPVLVCEPDDICVLCRSVKAAKLGKKLYTPPVLRPPAAPTGTAASTMCRPAVAAFVAEYGMLLAIRSSRRADCRPPCCRLQHANPRFLQRGFCFAKNQLKYGA